MEGRLYKEILIDKGSEEILETMPTYVRRWYVNMKASDKTAATRRDYLQKVRKFLQYIDEDVANVNLSDITEDSVAEYYMSCQTKEKDGEIVYTSDSYQYTVYSCLNNFLGYLTKTGQIEHNYIDLIDRPKNRDIDRINANRVLLTENDFRKILDAVKQERSYVRRTRDEAIILVFMNTGMRKTALTNIMMKDINLEDGTITVVDKGNKRHEYVINDGLKSALSAWVECRDQYASDEEDHFFVSDHGHGMGATTVADLVGKYTERGIGKRISPHKLRSGYCSILYNKTGDIEFVRRAVGHSNSATTQRYIVTKGEEKRKAAEIMSSLF